MSCNFIKLLIGITFSPRTDYDYCREGNQNLSQNL